MTRNAHQILLGDAQRPSETIEIPVKKQPLAFTCELASFHAFTGENYLMPKPPIVDVFAYDVLDLNELTQEVDVDNSTGWRWCLRGIAGVKLPSAKLGSKRVTTRACFQWWCEQVAAAKAGQQEEPVRMTRERQIEAAEREIADMGM